ncbi:MAG TPA: ubiquitin-like small modifier protein 1 [Dehalococcoidia bacterium]|nr:ubiquitin-like small modifier protein 1 [Dehalococcoidia bacterium]
MEVKVYATLRPIVGGRSVTLEPGDSVPASDCAITTIRDVLHQLIGRFPDLAERLLDDEGAVRPYVAVMVDGRDIRHTGGLDTPVPPDSQLDIFPPVAGGAANARRISQS